MCGASPPRIECIVWILQLFPLKISTYLKKKNKTMVQSMIIKSNLPAAEIPEVDIPTFFFDQASQLLQSGNESRAMFVDGKDTSQSLNLPELRISTDKLASGFYHQAGVREGDIVAIILPNSIHYLSITLALLSLGAVCTLVNPAYTAAEIMHQLDNSQAKHVITVTGMSALVKEAIGGRNVSILTADGSEELSILAKYQDTKEFPRPSPQSLFEKPAYIPYSSGTTGLPKGVVLSHKNIIANILQVNGLYGDAAANNGTSLAILPMFHSFGLLFQCFSNPLRGVQVIVLAKFDMVQFLTLVQSHQVTETMLVPPIINALIKLPLVKDYDLSSLKRVTVGAAPLSSDTIAALEKQQPQMVLLQGYGMSEASPAISINSKDLRNPKSVGPLLSHLEAKIVDDEGRPLGVGQVGELCVRGPNVMLEYLDNPIATQETIDPERFLHTGDVGYIDQDQFVFITDRKKELIKYKGYQVAPAELEGILMQHPKVKDCAVAGVYDDERATEVPRAYLVLTEEDAGEEVVGWVHGKVAYYKQLRGGYKLLDTIPKNASGKILRRHLNS